MPNFDKRIRDLETSRGEPDYAAHEAERKAQVIAELDAVEAERRKRIEEGREYTEEEKRQRRAELEELEALIEERRRQRGRRT